MNKQTRAFFALGLRWCGLALVLGAVLFPTKLVAQTPRTDQEITENELVDHGYLFNLQLGDLDWHILSERDVGMIVPEAAGGFSDLTTGQFLVVIVEQAPGLDPSTAASALVEMMPLESLVIESFEQITFQQLPAVRYVVSGYLQGMHFRYGNIVVSRLGYLYQIMCYGMEAATSSDGSTFQPMWDTFGFLPATEVPGRDTLHQVPDEDGVGWRVRDGNFESAVYGFTVEPGDGGWRVAIGTELLLMNPAAEVGLVHTSPEVYVALVPELVTGLDHAAFDADLRSTFAIQMAGSVASDELEMVIGGIPMTLSIHPSPGAYQPMDFGYGVFWVDDVNVQVIASWVSGLGETALLSLPEAFSLISLLPETERTALRDELLDQPDSQNTVGADFTLRDGLYQDYLYGFTWTKPRGFWRVTVGQDARAVNPDARLFLEEPVLGLAAVVIAEPFLGLTAEMYHSLIVSAIVPGGSPDEPIIRNVAGSDFRASWLDVDLSGLELRYLVASAVSNELSLQFLVWGLPGNAAVNETTMWEALDGFAVVGPSLTPTTTTPTGFVDRRLGFEVGVPAGWRAQDLTPLELQPMATLLMVSPNDSAGFLVLSMCATSEGQDAAIFEQLVEGELLRHFTEEMNVSMGIPVESTLDGYPSRLTTGSTETGFGQVALHIVQRGNTFYALLIFDEFGMAGLTVEEMATLFSFLD